MPKKKEVKSKSVVRRIKVTEAVEKPELVGEKTHKEELLAEKARLRKLQEDLVELSVDRLPKLGVLIEQIDIELETL